MSYQDTAEDLYWRMRTSVTAAQMAADRILADVDDMLWTNERWAEKSNRYLIAASAALKAKAMEDGDAG